MQSMNLDFSSITVSFLSIIRVALFLLRWYAYYIIINYILLFDLYFSFLFGVADFIISDWVSTFQGFFFFWKPCLSVYMFDTWLRTFSVSQSLLFYDLLLFISLSVSEYLSLFLSVSLCYYSSLIPLYFPFNYFSRKISVLVTLCLCSQLNSCVFISSLFTYIC